MQDLIVFDGEAGRLNVRMTRGAGTFSVDKWLI